MVQAWTLVLAFAAGLVVGVVASRLVTGRGRSTAPVVPVSAAEPVATAPEPIPETAATGDPAAVDNVVAELERRVKGRRTEAEASRPTGSGPGPQE